MVFGNFIKRLLVIFNTRCVSAVRIEITLKKTQLLPETADKGVSMKLVQKYMFFAIILAGLAGILSACAGPDYMPQYFPVQQKDPATSVQAPIAEGEEISTGSCIVNLTSQLCVAISGEGIEVGTGDKEPLCTEVDPIPMEVTGGTNIVLRGSDFPDIPFEGHGLPAPIIINGKGTGDGSDNIATGKVDGSGNIIIEGFSFFINALGMVGEVPDLMLTTGEIDDLEGLPLIEGSPLAADGGVKLVTGTIIGHLFPAADEKLLGASLQATFEGTMAPPLSDCKGGDLKPQSTFVTKLVVDEAGAETEAILPGATRLEVGSAYIAQSPQDIGPQFEASAKFKIVNATAKQLSIEIPPVVGPFYIEAGTGDLLKQQLPPKSPLTLKIIFRPTKENTPKEGAALEMLTIGSDVYQLVGEAVSPSGKITPNITDDKGGVLEAVDNINVGDVEISTTGRREFFTCKKITCNGTAKDSQCVPCVDVLINVCQLLPVDDGGNPVGTVDGACNPVNSKSNDSLSIGISAASATPASRVIKIKNSGIKPLSITKIEVQDIGGSKSTRQFRATPETALPIDLEPFSTTSNELNITVVYEPDDLKGLDGSYAVVGHPVKDKAVLRIVAEGSSKSIELVGTTSIKESPALQVYFKSASGVKEQVDGSQFAFRGITETTSDLAVPVFIKLSDSGVAPIRITKITLKDASSFEWLDTKDKIASKGCAEPVFDAGGGQISSITDLNPVSLLPNGFDLKPGAYGTDSMPLFGCVNFHKGVTSGGKFGGTLAITAVEIGPDGSPARNPDGSLRQTTFNVGLLAVINPLKGHVVFRLTQTMAAILNPQYSSISAVAAKKEMDIQIADGLAGEVDRFVMPSALILDPFDEDNIKDEAGNVVSVAGDGITAVYRNIDTRPMKDPYEDPLLPDYSSLIFDSSAPEGSRGLFFDYPNVPEGLKSGGLRMYTASLSYPGPLASPEDRPENVSLCEQVDPCSEEGQKMHGTGPKDKSKRGVCAFFYGSAGAWDSPALHGSDEMEGGEYKDLCKMTGEHQKLNDIAGLYNLDGNLAFPDMGLRLWGPNYFNNPVGPLGNFPPLDAILHLAFTTGVLKPKVSDSEPDVIPDKRVSLSKLEYKINLTDTKAEGPRLCDNAVKNRYLHGEYYSTWRYLEPFLSKDEEGTVSAGCPEADNKYNGGSAYLHGRPLNQETGIVTFVTAAKFASDDNLTFAFKDVMLFVVLNGWFCDPGGSEDQFEGARCFENTFNDRDASSTVSFIK